MKRIISSLLVASVLMLGTSCTAEKGAEKESNNQENNAKLEVEVLKELNNDCSDLALEYLNYIGTNLVDRSFADDDSQHDDTVEYIISELKAAGYDDSQIVSEKNNEYPEVHNVVVNLPGKNHDKKLVVGAHYDGDGVGDNGSGLALLLATAVNLCNETPAYDVQFVFFDAEEEGFLGASDFVSKMTPDERDDIIYMVNIDSIAFGDYCCVYGGYSDVETGEVSRTDAYEIACLKAKNLGMEVYGPSELDGYYKEHGEGPEIKKQAIYTNPWTYENPAPIGDFGTYSPSTIPASDHVPFDVFGIPYMYFEATNWFAGSGMYAYTGYFETYDDSIGEGGMFMNTKYDTLENLNKYFPDRAKEHFEVYSPLLTSVVMDPLNESN